MTLLIFNMAGIILSVVIILCLVIIVGLNIYDKIQERKEKNKNNQIESVLSDYRKKNESLKDK